AVKTLGIQLQSVEIQQPDRLDRAFAAIVAERAGAVVVTGDPFTFTHRVRIVTLAAKHRLPAVDDLPRFFDAAGLLTYAASLPDLWRRVATYVDRILKGAKPADLPVEQPTKFEVVINLKTAKALGLTIPPSVLARADEIIQ